MITDAWKVHTSDTSTFKRCRRRWDWTSPMRYNLRPSVASSGINFNLTFGTCIHSVLEGYYGSRDREKYNVEDHFAREWRTVTDIVQEKNPLFYTEHEGEFIEHMDLGLGMMEHYKEWSLLNDDFIVINLEHPFAVDTGLMARELDSGVRMPVQYCGRLDMIVQDRDTGKYGIMDHKTSSRHEDEDYIAKLDMDEQVTRYAWAAELEAKQKGLPYTKIDFVYYNILFKGYPRPPSITSRGVPSINRQTESTTPQLFGKTIMENEAYQLWYKQTEKAQEYYQWLKEVGIQRFIRREFLTRNRQEIQSCADRVFMEIEDMLSPDLNIYPNPTGDWYCLKCPFRVPCIAAMDGTDVGFILETSYEENMDEEGQYTSL